MPDSKNTFHAPITRDMSSVRDLVPVTPPPSGGQPPHSRSGQRPSGGSGQGFNAQFVLGAMRRWWKIALPFALLLSAGAVFIVFKTFVPQYEAVATLEFKESPGYIAFDHGGGASGPYFQTQVELIRSPWTIDRVLDNEKIKQLPDIQEQNDPGEWLTKRVLVGRRGLSDLMDIRYSSSDRDHVALVVNEVTRQYLDRLSDEEAKNRERLREALAAQEGIWKEAVGSLKKQVEAVTEHVSGEEPDLAQPDPNSPAHNPLSDLQTRLIGLQVEHVMLTAKIRAGEEDLKQAKAADATQGKTKIAEDAPLSKDENKLRDDMLRRALAYSPEARQLSAQKRARLRSLETTLKQGKNNPMYITAEKGFVTKEHNLEDSIRDEVEATLRAKRNESGVTTVSMRQEELDHLKKEEHGYKLAEENLKIAYGEKLKALLKDFQQRSGERLNLTFMKDELGQKQSVLDRITQRLIEMQTEQAAPSLVEWRIEAHTPDGPIEAIPFKRMELFGIAAFCLPLCLGGRLGSHRAAHQRLRRIGTALAFGSPRRDLAAAHSASRSPRNARRSRRFGATGLPGEHRQPADRTHAQRLRRPARHAGPGDH